MGLSGFPETSVNKLPIKESEKNSLTVLSVKTGLIGYPETSARNYHSSSRNIPKERRSKVRRLFGTIDWTAVCGR